MTTKCGQIIPENAVLIPPEAKLVFQGQIFDVYQWPQTMYDGQVATFEMLKRPNTVETICIHDDKIIILDDEQPNRGARRSFVGGRVDPDDHNPESAAKREVLEEVGFTFENWRLIRVWQPYNKIEWFIYLFVAWSGRQVSPPSPDSGEKITAEHLPFAEVKRLVLSKTGHLGEASPLFEKATSTRDLINLPEFNQR
jgi:ADP-ribose pyrophosphatase